MNKVLRQEYKYQLAYLEYKKLLAKFKQILHDDAHNGLDGYVVRSLYFDTMVDRDFFEKQAGIEKRQKMRLRIYDPKADFAMLEMKQKQGKFQQKRSLKVTREDAIQLCQANYSVLLQYSEPFALECFVFLNENMYRPKTIVEYKRYAFTADGNETRVTFDHDIRATESCYDIFSEDLCMYPVCDPACVTMEVKYNNFLFQHVKDAVNNSDKIELSLSKYAMARSATLGR